MGGEITLDVAVLRERWMKLYINICILKSRDPEREKRIREVALKFMELNEDVMPFFDYLEGVEPEGSGNVEP